MQTLVDFDAMRADRELLERVLRDAGTDMKGTSCRCPFHDDKTPSAGIYQSDTGAWRFKCNADSCGAGGDVLDLLQRIHGIPDKAATIKKFRDILPDSLQTAGGKPTVKEKPAVPPKVYPDMEDLEAAVEWSDKDKGGGKIAKRYFYRHPETQVDELIVFRLERADGSKTFRQAHPVEGGFVMKKPPFPLPLYNREGINDAETVVVCEGEKTVEALKRIGIAATTSAGGAGKAELTDWSPLAGKRCYLWPDADGEDPKTQVRAGIEHMKQVGECLRCLPKFSIVYVVDPYKIADLPYVNEGGDAADLIEALENAYLESDQIKALIENEVFGKAKLLGPAGDLKQSFDDIITGRIYAVPMPWPILTHLTQALMPGTITVLCGSPGSTKSFSVLQMATPWYDTSVPFSILMLEDDRTFHLRRLLAQRVQIADMTKLHWIREHPVEVEQYFNEQAEWLTGFAHNLHCVPTDAVPDVDFVLQWMNAQAVMGKRIIVVDPITLIRTGDKLFREQERLLGDAKKLAERYALSIFWVSHPKKGAPTHTPTLLTLDDVSGVAGLTRASQCVLWLDAHKHKDDMIAQPHDSPIQVPTSQTHNRTMIVMKTRNGCGTGAHLAFEFSADNLLLTEIGRISG